jgi:D-alanine transaminase
MKQVLFLNGRFMPLSKGCIKVEDRGFQFADGVYDVLRVYNGRMFRAKEHLARLEEGAREIGIETSSWRNKMERILKKLIQRSGAKELALYIQITRGAAPRTHGIPKAIRPTVLAYTMPVNPDWPRQRREGVCAVSMLDDRWGRCNLKTIALLANVLAREEARRRGAEEPIFVSARGTVYEGGSSNVYCIHERQLSTPPVGPKVLPGVTRQVVLEIAREIGLRVSESPRNLKFFKSADEAFLTSSTREIIPIVRIDERAVGSGKPGSWTRKLQKQFQEVVKKETLNVE